MTTAATEQSVIAALRADATLTALAPGGVFRDIAPQGTTTPFVIVSLHAHEDRYQQAATVAGEKAFEELTVMIKAVDAAQDGSAAQAADDRIYALLQAGGFTISGYSLVNVQRTERLAFTEDDEDSDQRWQHRGGLYECTVQPS